MGKRFRQLTQTATDADLVEGNYFGVDTPSVTKKVPANLLAKQSALETTNGNVTALTTYAQSVAHSIAPEFDPTRDSEHAYPAGYSVTYTDGKVYTFKVDHFGAWDAADVTESPKVLNYLNDVISKNCVNVVGKGNTATKYKVKAAPSGILHVSLSSSDWDDDEVSTGLKFAISSVAVDGTSTDLLTVSRGVDQGREIFLFTRSDTDFVQITFRANAGESVLITCRMLSSADIQSFVNDTVVRPDCFELGNISMSESNLTYTSSTSRLRTKKNFAFSLKKYDCIVALPGYQMYIASSSDGNAPYTTVGWKTIYTAKQDEKVHFLLRRSVEESFSFKEASRSFFVYSVDSDVVCKNLIETLNVNNNYLEWDIDGIGNSLVVRRFKAAPGATLSFVCNPTGWPTTSAQSGSSAMYGVRKVLSDNTTVNLFMCHKDFGYVLTPVDIVVPDDAVYLEVFLRADVGVAIKVCCTFTTDIVNSRVIKSFVRGINHRGYCTVAPENTLSAFRLSKKFGFDYIETDVRGTADGALVCIHDETVDRTSNGTGEVSQMTLAQLKTLDFGSWKSQKYAGEKIPTLEEAVAECRKLGVGMYLHIYSAYASIVFSIISKYSMVDKCTILCNEFAKMQEFENVYSRFRLGLVRMLSVSQSDIENLLTIKTTSNDVFVDVDYSIATDALIASCKSSGLPLEIFTGTIGEYERLRNINEYIGGVTHNKFDYSNILATDAMNDDRPLAIPVA